MRHSVFTLYVCFVCAFAGCHPNDSVGDGGDDSEYYIAAIWLTTENGFHLNKIGRQNVSGMFSRWCGINV